MSLDSQDLVDALLTEQARVNQAVDEGDVNNLVADYQFIQGDLFGFTEQITTSVTHPNHLWDDNQSAYGFFNWA